jgi:transglutaminase-like putative cysteine protease
VRYRITHRTAYRYTSPAYESFTEVRLPPVSAETQHCLAFGEQRAAHAGGVGV